MECWRCHKHFVSSPTGNCLYCGYSQDQAHEEKVRDLQAFHDQEGGDDQNSGQGYSYDNFKLTKTYRKSRKKKINARTGAVRGNKHGIQG